MGTDGQPVGVPEPMPWVQLAAVSKEQTKNVMIMTLAMAPKGSWLVAEYGIDLGKEVIYKPGGGRLEIITSSARTAEGNRPTIDPQAQGRPAAYTAPLAWERSIRSVSMVVTIASWSVCGLVSAWW
jgi:hypothetical protein